MGRGKRAPSCAGNRGRGRVRGHRALVPPVVTQGPQVVASGLCNQQQCLLVGSTAKPLTHVKFSSETRGGVRGLALRGVPTELSQGGRPACAA